MVYDENEELALKLSCSSWSHHRAFDAGAFTLVSWIEHCAKTLGLDGVEIENKHFKRTDATALSSVRQGIANHGLALANVTTFNDFGHESNRQNQRELEGVKRWIDHALTLGSPSLRVFAGWPKGERTSAWERMLEYLAQATEYAKRQGLMLVLENHNHGGFIQTSEDTLRALAAIDSPYLRPLLDTGNYLDGLASIEKVIHLAPHVHAKLLTLDAAGREINIDHAQIVEWLAQRHYDGFISVEYEGTEDEQAAVARGVDYLKGLISQYA